MVVRVMATDGDKNVSRHLETQRCRAQFNTRSGCDSIGQPHAARADDGSVTDVVGGQLSTRNERCCARNVWPADVCSQDFSDVTPPDWPCN